LNTDTPPVIRVGFVNPTTHKQYIADNQIHEVLAREICSQEGFNWQEKGFSAVDYLIEEQGFIKIANYGFPHNYVALLNSSPRQIINMASEIALSLNLRLLMY